MRIEVHDRKIRCDGQPLGLQHDNKVETVAFVLPQTMGGTDLSQGVAYLTFCRADGKKGVVPLDKALEGDRMVLSWQVGRQMTEAPGLLQVQLKISGLEDVLWHSEIAGFAVGKSISEDSGQSILPLEPEACLPITVAERRLQIPSAYRRIAAQNDQNSQQVPLRLPRYFSGRDLSEYDIFLKTVSSGGRDDVALIPTRVDATQIECLWTLGPPQTSYAGSLSLQLRITGEGFRWESEAASVEIIPSLDGEPAVPGTPSYLDGMLEKTQQAAGEAKRWAAASATAAQKGPVIGEDGCWHLWDAQTASYQSTGRRAEADLRLCTFSIKEETGELQIEFPEGKGRTE
ncbi:hypothetical protein [Zongyangia hominis]|uniref:Uncharacterized protein n=1 Tax=Zongyangia hominis TaxID=2763677 RepID=A0A926EEX1_9FIRM|nr:hypothetical protein [Zongyangia hominis]MBC8570611.1 hypothetical protein [Zongyangia hominis]